MWFCPCPVSSVHALTILEYIFHVWNGDIRKLDYTINIRLDIQSSRNHRYRGYTCVKIIGKKFKRERICCFFTAYWSIFLDLLTTVSGFKILFREDTDNAIYDFFSRQCHLFFKVVPIYSQEYRQVPELSFCCFRKAKPTVMDLTYLATSPYLS